MMDKIGITIWSRTKSKSIGNKQSKTITIKSTDGDKLLEKIKQLVENLGEEDGRGQE